METYISLAIRSVSRSGQSLHCPHEESLKPYLPIAISRSSSLSAKKVIFNFLRDFFFFFRARGVRGETRKKRYFSWAELYMYIPTLLTIPGQTRTIKLIMLTGSSAQSTVLRACGAHQ